MKTTNHKLLRIGSITVLYLSLAIGSLFILAEPVEDEAVSTDQMIANEVGTMENLKLIHDAQQKYREVDWDEDGKKTFAQFVVHLWQTVDGRAHPVGSRFISKDLAFAMGETKAIDGYFFSDIYYKKVAEDDAQNNANRREDAPEEIELDFTREFAIAALPAKYNRTGLLSFVIDQSGAVFAKDDDGDKITATSDNWARLGWNQIKDRAGILKLHSESERKEDSVSVQTSDADGRMTGLERLFALVLEFPQFR